MLYTAQRDVELTLQLDGEIVCAARVDNYNYADVNSGQGVCSAIVRLQKRDVVRVRKNFLASRGDLRDAATGSGFSGFLYVAV